MNGKWTALTILQSSLQRPHIHPFTHTFVLQWLAASSCPWLGGSRFFYSPLYVMNLSRLAAQMVCFCCRVSLLRLTGLDKNFNQWDPLIDGEDEHLIKGTNVITLQSAIWTAFTRCSTHLLDCWLSAPTGSTRSPAEQSQMDGDGPTKDMWAILSE